MPAVWTAPRTWSTGELVTAALMNEHIRDNLEFLKGPPSNQYIGNLGADWSTTSTTYALMDNTNLNLSITTVGGDVLIVFAAVSLNSGGITFYDVEVDGVRTGGDDGLMGCASTNIRTNATVIKLLTGLAAGAHTFKMMHKVSAGTGSTFAGAGTSNADFHPQFFVREVS
jgi:hypothetical protein